MTRSGNRQQQLTAQAGQSDMDLLVEEYSTLTKKKKKKKKKLKLILTKSLDLTIEERKTC